MNFEQIMEVLNSNSAIISTLSALIAILFSIFVWFHTRKLLKPTERPILDLIFTATDTKEISEPERMIGYQIIYRFKNIGKHPAKDLRIRSVSLRKDNLEIVGKQSDDKMENRINPGNEFNYRKEEIRLEVRQGEAVINKQEIYIYLFLDCKDSYNPKKIVRDEFLFCYVEGESTPEFATTKDKKAIESKITELYPDRKKIK